MAASIPTARVRHRAGIQVPAAVAPVRAHSPDDSLAVCDVEEVPLGAIGRLQIDEDMGQSAPGFLDLFQVLIAEGGEDRGVDRGLEQFVLLQGAGGHILLDDIQEIIPEVIAEVADRQFAVTVDQELVADDEAFDSRHLDGFTSELQQAREDFGGNARPGFHLHLGWLADNPFAAQYAGDGVFATNLVDERLDPAEIYVSVLHDVFLSRLFAGSIPLPEVMGATGNSPQQRMPYIRRFLLWRRFSDCQRALVYIIPPQIPHCQAFAGLLLPGVLPGVYLCMVAGKEYWRYFVFLPQYHNDRLRSLATGLRSLSLLTFFPCIYLCMVAGQEYFRNLIPLVFPGQYFRASIDRR